MHSLRAWFSWSSYCKYHRSLNIQYGLLIFSYFLSLSSRHFSLPIDNNMYASRLSKLTPMILVLGQCSVTGDNDNHVNRKHHFGYQWLKLILIMVIFFYLGYNFYHHDGSFHRASYRFWRCYKSQWGWKSRIILGNERIWVQFWVSLVALVVLRNEAVTVATCNQLECQPSPYSVPWG